MTVNRTTLLDLPIITTGTESGAWGNITNNGLSQYMDIAIAGMTSLTSANFTAGALTIANTQGDSSATNIAAGSAQYATIKVSSLAANSTITAPSSNRAYRIINADGTYTLTIKASGQTGVTFPINTSGIVVFNGTDYVLLGSYVIASAGTASLPSITTTGDTNTGIYFPAADTIAFTEGGAESMRIDSSGNLGLGVTPSAWNSGAKALQISSTSSFYGTSNATLIGQNTFNNTSGNNIYLTTAAASLYQQFGGAHSWYTAPSGTAGNTITFTQAMTLDASGNLGLGATSITAISSGYATAHIGGANGGGVKLGTSSTSHGYLAGSATNIELGATSNIFLSFFTNNAERARITSGGFFLIKGTTALAELTVQGQGAFGSTGSGGNGIYLYINNALSDNSYLSRVSSGSGTTTWYIGNQSITTSSDARLKANIKPSERNALELLQQWEIVDHTWNDPSDQSVNNRNSRGVWTGVVAQQVQSITPWLVNKPTEEIDKDGSINPWTMDFGYAVPLLVKAIQELKAELDTVKAELAALKGA